MSKRTSKNQSPKWQQSGFSLMELLVVMIILGLLASIVAPSMFGKVDSSKVKTAQTQISMLETAIDTYVLDVGDLPRELKALVESSSKGWDGPYLKKGQLPLDPWDNPYQLKVGDGYNYEIVSLGADGKPGGEGKDADISSLQ